MDCEVEWVIVGKLSVAGSTVRATIYARQQRDFGIAGANHAPLAAQPPTRKLFEALRKH